MGWRPTAGASKLRPYTLQCSAAIMRAVLRSVDLRRGAGIIAALLAGVLAACATPAQRLEQRATALGFTSLSLRGDGFLHHAYTAGLESGADALHVYVEHDGTPWLDLRYVSQDPTPRNPLALELMARDTGPRLFLGRPCYFEPADDPRCGPLLWTHRRYSPEVVTSMVAALREFLAMHSYRRVVLVGYSGGGTLAWLMAGQVPEAVAVITVAANLDTDSWTSLHGYSRLDGSLNPAQLAPLPPAIVEVHYVGGRDRNVPPAVAASFAGRNHEARIVVVDDFDHECCWVARWPQLLGDALGAPPATVRRPD
jgi:dienelactone hydrolase